MLEIPKQWDCLLAKVKFVIDISPKQVRRIYIKNVFKNGWFGLGTVD